MGRLFSGVFARIFLSASAVSALAILILAVVNYIMVERIQTDSVRTLLRSSSMLTASAIAEGEPLSGVRKTCLQFAKESGVRTTIVDSNGNVVFDTSADTSAMQNHLTRVEIKKALDGNTQYSRHYSKTLGMPMFYVAAPAGKKTASGFEFCVRQSVPMRDLMYTKNFFMAEIAGASFLAFALCGIFSYMIARSISAPLKSLKESAKRLSAGDFEARAQTSSILEISELTQSVATMAATLKKRLKSLHKRNCELDEIFAHMNEAVFICALDGRVLRLNDSCIKLFNADRALLVAERKPNVSEAFRNSKITGLVEKTFSEGHLVCDFDLEGDVEKTFSFVGIMLPYESKQPRALFVLHDISILRTNETLRREFVAGVSHELKTPITSVRAAAETLRDLEADTAKRRFLAIIEKDAERMNALVDDMLLLSRIEFAEKNAAENFCEVNLKLVVEEAVSAHESEAEIFGDNVCVNAAEDVVVRGDFVLLQIAVSNLVGNAIKYGGKNCRVSVCVDKNAEGLPRISVSDTGCGIQKEHLGRIFERFYRVDKGRSRNLGGTGLGLAIVKHVALLHGATISVRSEVGEGSTFSITFNA